MGFNLIEFSYLLYVFGQTGMSKQCRPRSDTTECITETVMFAVSLKNWSLHKKKGKRKVQGVPQSQTPAPKRKRKPTNPNKHKSNKSNKRTKSTQISSLFPKRGNLNTKRTEKHKNKMTHGKTYNKSPRRINHKATNNKTNIGTTALERSVE